MRFANAALCGSLAFTAALFAASADSAAQQFLCNQRNDALGHLAKIYQELPIPVGVTNRGGLVEVLSTGDGKTWTIIISSTDGESAAGKSWHALPETGARDGSQA